MPSATSTAAWRHRPEAVMAALGLVSGVLSATIGFDLELKALEPVGWIFLLAPGALPIGFFFGSVIALGMWMATGNGWTLPVLPVTTMYAWSAAIQAAIRLQRTADDVRI